MSLGLKVSEHLKSTGFRCFHCGEKSGKVFDLYSIKIKEQTRKLAAGCSKHCFEVVDKTDEFSHIYTARRR
ncbi:hypothetical protein DG474_01995 [Streptococcus oralis]|nr:hypothetical protein DG474_01995 [Streptococcus oralis]